MRADMKKVLCERPRARAIYSYRDFRIAIKHADYDSLPKQQGMRRPYFADPKEFNDLISPLIRYLEGCVGRYWNDVWSDVCHNVPSNNTVDGHLKQHVERTVTTHTYVSDSGEVRALPGHRLYDLYVDPRDGAVRRFETRSKIVQHLSYVWHLGYVYCRGADGVLYPSNFGRIPTPPYPVKPIDAKHDACQVAGIWYMFDVKPLIPVARHAIDTNGELKVEWIIPAEFDTLTRSCVTSGHYRCGKRQLSSKELHRLKLHNRLS